MGQRKHRPPANASSPAARNVQQALWMYGRHSVLAAVRNPRRHLDRLLATAETAAELERTAATAPVQRPRVEIVDRRVIAALLPPDVVHQGFAALARPLPACGLDMVITHAREAPRAVVIVLDQVTDPRNVGAVLRSAEAFAAVAVVVQDRRAPEESGALAKAASGAMEAMPLIRVTNLARALRSLQEAEFRCIGLAGDAPLALAQVSLHARLALVLGAEGAGLRRLVRQTCDVVVRIPIAPTVDSLNIAAAAAIALYECQREILTKTPEAAASSSLARGEAGGS
jgi:23S rRNA (guanosine2251-2'-O)-methyltransferase